MSRQRPPDVAVCELLRANLARESAIGLVEDVLRADFDLGFQVFADDEQVQAWWGDDDLCHGNSAETAIEEDPGGPLPVLGSREALLRLWTMSVMLLIVPFLQGLTLP